MNTISKTLRLFLDSIGRRSEYEFYLRKFQSDRSPCFALVIPEAGCVEASGDLMAFDLHFLLRLELCPLLVLCGEGASDDADELARHVAVERLEAAWIDRSDAELRASLSASLAAERVPVLLLPDREIRDAVPGLAPRLARRIHWLRTAGMLHDPEGEKLFYLYLKRSRDISLAPGDRSVADTAESWLARDPQLHVSISSPLYLLQEMFTVKGRGSIIRPGSTFLHAGGVEEVDRERLLRLMEEAFGRRLRDPAILDRAGGLIVESEYRGAVMLEDHPAGSYLGKFAVGTQARGEGVAQELWDIACEPRPRLFWRSRYDNPVNQWYERHATGHHTEGLWTVFWKGIAVEHLPEIIRYALDRPSDFLEPESS